MQSSRRELITGLAGALVGAFLQRRAPAEARPVGPTRTPAGAHQQTQTASRVVGGAGQYVEFPFTVPPGTARIDVRLDKDNPSASLGVGLFDQRGAGYQSPGFRGIYGTERSSFFVAPDAASQSFLPGPIGAGTWTVLVPVFQAPTPTAVTVTFTTTPGPSVPPTRPGPEVGTVVDAPGWYRGDLHCHTPESSDAWASGTALHPADWARTCRDIRLDFVALTDHNVVSQNRQLARDAGEGVLLMPGEEMTNWFHGHATVSGIEVGQWLDWRQSPWGAPLPTAARTESGRPARIQDFLRLAEEMGAYVAAAHPLAGSLGWQFLAEAQTIPSARTPGFEVWNGQFQPDDELALRTWDGMLARGFRVWANGGSDLHGVDNDAGSIAGTPTTVVYASALSKPAVVAALKAGRSFVTRRPDGVECYLTGRSTDGRQHTYLGGTVYGDVGDPVVVSARVRRAGGMRLTFISGAAPVSTIPLDDDDATVTTTVPIPPGGGYLRGEVRSRPRPVPGNPTASATDMECLTNPILLGIGDHTPGYRP